MDVPIPGTAIPSVNIIRCDDWGAQAAKTPIDTVEIRPTMIVVHHTATGNVTDVSRNHAISLARSIQQSHFSRGWSDTGQHFLVTRGGIILEGRHGSYEAMASGAKHVIGAHTQGKNDVAIGIENEGNYMSVEPPDALWYALAELCGVLCRLYGLTPDDIYGHRDFNPTLCCGDKLYNKLGDLRHLVKMLLLRRRCDFADSFRPVTPWF